MGKLCHGITVITVRHMGVYVQCGLDVGMAHSLLDLLRCHAGDLEEQRAVGMPEPMGRDHFKTVLLADRIELIAHPLGVDDRVVIIGEN